MPGYSKEQQLGSQRKKYRRVVASRKTWEKLRDEHDDVHRRVRTAAYALLSTLTDAEYAYMIQRGGEDYPERAYGIEYARA